MPFAYMGTFRPTVLTVKHNDTTPVTKSFQVRQGEQILSMERAAEPLCRCQTQIFFSFIVLSWLLTRAIMAIGSTSGREINGTDYIANLSGSLNYTVEL